MTGRPATGRRTAVVLAVLLGAAALLVSTVPWVRASGSSALEPVVPVDVPGTVAAPGVGATGLTLLAAGIALALVRRTGRWVVVLVLAAAGVLCVVSAVGVWADPGPAARAAVADATGVGTLVEEPVVSAAPVLAAGIGALAVALAVWVALTSGRWPQGSDRHERPAEPPDGTDDGHDGRADWDALTRGEDPTDP